MRLDKRGDLGFPEAMMAVMIVTLVLSMYIGIFVLNVANEETSDTQVDKDIVKGLTIRDGRIEGDITMKMVAVSEIEGYRGIVLRCIVPGGLAENEEFSVGNMDGHITSERFLRNLPSDDGKNIPVIFEVAICI